MVPVGGVPDRPPQETERQLANQAQVLGQRNESVGSSMPRVGWFHRGQHFETEGAAVGEVDQRLVVGNDGAGADRPAQVGLQRGAVAQRRVDASGRRRRSWLGGACLGPVHRHVGPLDERFTIGCVVGEEGDADAGADLAR